MRTNIKGKILGAVATAVFLVFVGTVHADYVPWILKNPPPGPSA